MDKNLDEYKEPKPKDYHFTLQYQILLITSMDYYYDFTIIISQIIT